MRQPQDITPYLRAFENVRNDLPGLSATDDLRSGAIERFKSLGLPHRRLEAWKYTDLRPFQRHAFTPLFDRKPPAGAVPDGVAIAGLSGSQLVFRNGRFDARSSHFDDLGGRLIMTSLVKALADGDEALRSMLGSVSEADPLAQLNTAMMADGAVIRIAPDTAVDEPIELLYYSEKADACAVHMRTIIILEDGASADIVESYGGDETAYWTNSVTQIMLGKGATLDHAVRQTEGPRAVHTGKIMIEAAADARYRNTALNQGAQAARRDYRVTLNGEKASAELAGVQLARSGQALDTVTYVDHAVPNCHSDQPYRAVVDRGGRTAFAGKVRVRRNAQKTDAKQSSNNLLLDRTAEADTKPELEIYADDVQCAHGATVGELDEQALFYMSSRGIPPYQARALLIRAFIEEPLEGIANETVRRAFRESARGWTEQAIDEEEQP